MKNVLMILFVVVFSSGYSQDENSSADFRSVTGNYNCYSSGMWIPKNIRTENLGSVYLFDSWEGIYNVKLTNKVEFKLLNLNYSLKTNTLESKISKDSVFQYNNDEILSIYNGKNEYVFLNNILYQKLLVGNKISFYKNFVLNKKEAVFNPLTQTNLSEATFEKSQVYYFKINDNLQQIKLNKKYILNSLIDKKIDIVNFVKLNNISYTDESEVIKILNYYNSL